MCIRDRLLYCMLVVSANEACVILAEAVSGDVDTFVDAMNAKAQALGCENTHFVNPTGLHDSQHYTSAWDPVSYTHLLLPATIASVRAAAGCQTPFDILPAVWMSSALSVAAGLTAARVFSLLGRRRTRCV